MREFEFTPAWQQHVAARRGSLGAEPFTPRAGADTTTEALWTLVKPQVSALLSASDDRVRKAAVELSIAASQASPLAVAAQALVVIRNRQADPGESWIADAWIAERGLAFAAQAAVELFGLTVRDDGIVHLGPGQELPHYPGEPQSRIEVVLRVRAALAVAAEPEYRRIVSDLAAHRSRHAYHRLATSILAPTEASWVEQDLADAIAARDDCRLVALTQVISRSEQRHRLDAARSSPWTFDAVLANNDTYLATLTDGLGVDVLPVFLRWVDESYLQDPARRRLLSLIAQIPAEAAMRALTDRVQHPFATDALIEAGERFPALALQVLAGCESHGQLADLLSALVRTHPELAEKHLASASPQAANRVRAALEQIASAPEAPAQAVPPILIDPPWLNRGQQAEPVVMNGLTCADGPTISWLDGELDVFGAGPHHHYSPQDTASWHERAQRATDGQGPWWEDLAFFTTAPPELARPWLEVWTPHEWIEADHLRPVAARFGVQALPALLRRARSTSATAGPVLMPFSSPELAVLMADWLDRLKSGRALAGTWLQRHAQSAAVALLPPALGDPGKERHQARKALLYLASHGHRAAVVNAAQVYGDEAAAAIEVLVNEGALRVLPDRIPARPQWLSIPVAAPVRLKDGSGVLTVPAKEHLITVFALSSMDQPYAGLAVVSEAVHPEDLSAFAWALFQRWHAAGAPVEGSWALDGLGLVGDDTVVRELTPMILAWPGDGRHARAVSGLQVLTAIGTDVALMHLHSIAQRAKFKGLKAAAQEKMRELADGLGLTGEQLADRLVPTLGLDHNGSLHLNYGPRTFVVGFDEHLKPYVTAASGKLLKTLPKPGAKDDAELAEAAYQQFSMLKKDVRRIAPDVIQRLERAMVTGRRWSGEEFGRFFVAHPLLWHIARRLVWGRYDTDDHLIGAFRVAEDRTFADSSDEEVTLVDDVRIGVAHPWHLGADAPVWAELLADYEILQPFPQLTREVFALTEAEAQTGVLERFEGLKIATSRVLALERRGWRRDDPMMAGVQAGIDISFASGLEAGITLSPGIFIGQPHEWDTQTLLSVGLHHRSTGADEQRQQTGRPLPLQPADLVAVSEILRDLEEITRSPG
ncbi:DUF4132 domain-containing protein [Kineosporia sp. NBRC 101731]|uniref:DUF4132 domain-containing protein n=1 Tax=Kineosporia sp. NBRC 101731 TaxID=3032199 RepID=UPI0024A2133B|nr:DUF4132 domain-containing protein [Kineosporia sp. NBRC 101731]GLY29809.1 hypothetical protein Kisp02_31740 [Kineosporia sp. NBRC 101731]